MLYQLGVMWRSILLEGSDALSFGVVDDENA